MTVVELICLNAAGMSAVAVAVVLLKWRRTRTEKCALEDNVVEFYTRSLGRLDETLDEQEDAIVRLRENAREIVANRDADVEDTASTLQNELSRHRGQLESAASDQEASNVNWDTFFKAKADCESAWNHIVESLLKLNVRPLKKINELEALEMQRREHLAAAEIRVEDLERQIKDLLERTFKTRESLPEEDSAAATNAMREMEQNWGEALEEARKQDASLAQGITAMSGNCDNMDKVNHRLSSLTEMLRQRQKAMASRIEELETLAEMTPRLKEELSKLTEQNAELQQELHRLEESNQEFEKETSQLRETIESFETQPSRAEAAEAKMTQDRQVLQMLREQNQRLLFELDEAGEDIQEAKKSEEEARATAEAYRNQCQSMESEISQLLDQYGRLENSSDAKGDEAQKLLLELRRIREDRELAVQ